MGASPTMTEIWISRSAEENPWDNPQNHTQVQTGVWVCYLPLSAPLYYWLWYSNYHFNIEIAPFCVYQGYALYVSGSFSIQRNKKRRNKLVSLTHDQEILIPTPNSTWQPWSRSTPTARVINILRYVNGWIFILYGSKGHESSHSRCYSRVSSGC